MEINISSAVGSGSTELSAFDHALSLLGVRDQNLVPLSSVIPLGATIRLDRVNFNNNYQGDRVYCVYAEKRTQIQGESVVAGIGWVLANEDPQWGLFVEHTGHTKEEVENLIHDSLRSMVQYRKEQDWGEIQKEIVVATCETQPVCAMALAVYDRVDW